MKTRLDDISYETLTEVGLSTPTERAIKFRVEHGLAKMFDALPSDEGRIGLCHKLHLKPYGHFEGGFREDCGLVPDWQRLENVYIPKRWIDYMNDTKRPWNEAFLGILSVDERIMDASEYESPSTIERFNWTVLGLNATTQIYFFVYSPEWRSNVEHYAQLQLNHTAKHLRDLKSKPDNLEEKTDWQKQQRYIPLIEGLVTRYISEVNQ